MGAIFHKGKNYGAVSTDEVADKPTLNEVKSKLETMFDTVAEKTTVNEMKTRLEDMIERSGNNQILNNDFGSYLDFLKTDVGLKSLDTLPYEFFHGSAVVLNEEIHLLGGGNSGKTNHYKFNGTTWKSVSTLPYDFYQGSAVVLNNEIHLLGGLDDYTTSHYKWNGIEWTEVSTLPNTSVRGKAIVLNGEIHILGGVVVNAMQTSHYKWNGIEWTEVSTLPYGFLWGKAIVLNGEIHILGGTNGEQPTNHYKFNGTAWESVSTLPYDFYQGSAVVLNNEIHLLGDGHKNYRTNHYKFNGTAWESVSTLPYDFYQGSAVVLNNEIHILGGAYPNTHALHYNVTKCLPKLNLKHGYLWLLKGQKLNIPYVTIEPLTNCEKDGDGIVVLEDGVTSFLLNEVASKSLKAEIEELKTTLAGVSEIVTGLGASGGEDVLIENGYTTSEKTYEFSGKGTLLFHHETHTIPLLIVDGIDVTNQSKCFHNARDSDITTYKVPFTKSLKIKSSKPHSYVLYKGVIL